jgi:membrane protein YdbS with pleckstrin-like domain
MDRYYLGPASAYEYYLIFRSPLLWIAGLLFFIPFVSLDLSRHFSALQGIVGYNALFYLTGGLCVAAAIVVGHLQYKSTSFILEDGMLFISWGLVQQVSLTIPVRFILDCDISCGPTDQLFGVKSLHLSVMGKVAAGSSQMTLKFIKDAEDWRAFLLQNSAAGGRTQTWMSA